MMRRRIIAALLTGAGAYAIVAAFLTVKIPVDTTVHFAAAIILLLIGAVIAMSAK